MIQSPQMKAVGGRIRPLPSKGRVLRKCPGRSPSKRCGWETGDRAKAVCADAAGRRCLLSRSTPSHAKVARLHRSLEGPLARRRQSSNSRARNPVGRAPLRRAHLPSFNKMVGTRPPSLFELRRSFAHPRSTLRSTSNSSTAARHCEREAIHSFCGTMDCFAGARNDGVCEKALRTDRHPAKNSRTAVAVSAGRSSGSQ